MATKLVWTCDGCDKVASTDAGERPEGWSDVKIEISGLNIPYDLSLPEDVDAHFDLCASCQKRVARSTMPSKWARYEDTIK